MIKCLMPILFTGMLLTGCTDAAPTSFGDEAEESTPPTEYVWVDTLISSSGHEDHWQSANLLETSSKPDQGGWRDSAFVFGASFHPQYGGYCNVIGGWFWNCAVNVCCYDSVVVSGILTEDLFNAESSLKMHYTVGRSGFLGQTIKHVSSESDTIVTPFSFSATPDSDPWICGSILRFLFVAQVREDLISGDPNDESGRVNVRLSDVEIRGYRKVPAKD